MTNLKLDAKNDAKTTTTCWLPSIVYSQQWCPTSRSPTFSKSTARAVGKNIFFFYSGFYLIVYFPYNDCKDFLW